MPATYTLRYLEFYDHDAADTMAQLGCANGIPLHIPPGFDRAKLIEFSPGDMDAAFTEISEYAGHPDVMATLRAGMQRHMPNPGDQRYVMTPLDGKWLRAMDRVTYA